ncbi:hypothetical protein LEMLEM_LOCUS5907, partial [Lemmus lemmus]
MKNKWPFSHGHVLTTPQVFRVLIIQSLDVCILDAENTICVYVYSTLLSKTSLVDTLKKNTTKNQNIMKNKIHK